MTSTYPKRVLRAALFDALKAAAEKFGGIGDGTFYEKNQLAEAPVCGIGFLHYVGAYKGVDVEALGNAEREAKGDLPLNTGDSRCLFAKALELITQSIIGFPSWEENDRMVCAIRVSLGLGCEARVPFALWAERFNLHRAVELPAKLYDKIKSKAKENGGIGYGVGYSNPWGGERFPCCIGDYAAKIDGESSLGKAICPPTPTVALLEKALGISFGTINDNAVRAINKHKGTYLNRVTFDELAEELNIIRVVQLPAPIYDKLKAAAEQYGGIGAGSFRTYAADRVEGAPSCAAGLYADAIGSRDPWKAVDVLCKHIGNIIALSDDAVRVINARKGAATNKRVSFEEWARELNVDRVVVLPAQAYDRLKESAAKYGGIGADTFEATNYSSDEGGTIVPYCVAGHAALIDSDGTYPDAGMPTIQALQQAFGHEQYYQVFDKNDEAVHAINQRKGVADETARVSFAEWAKELGVVRGDA